MGRRNYNAQPKYGSQQALLRQRINKIRSGLNKNNPAYQSKEQAEAIEYKKSLTRGRIRELQDRLREYESSISFIISQVKRYCNQRADLLTRWAAYHDLPPLAMNNEQIRAYCDGMDDFYENGTTAWSTDNSRKTYIGKSFQTASRNAGVEYSAEHLILDRYPDERNPQILIDLTTSYIESVMMQMIQASERNKAAQAVRDSMMM